MKEILQKIRKPLKSFLINFKRFTLIGSKTTIVALAMILSISAVKAQGDVAFLGTYTVGTTNTFTKAKEAGSNRLLVVMAKARGSKIAESVTYGGQLMTKIIDKQQPINTNGTNNAYTSIFILNEAGINAAGSEDIAVTWSIEGLQTETQIRIVSFFLQNVDQVTPVTSSAGNNAFASTLTTSALTAGEGDMVLVGSTLESNNQSSVMDNGFTQYLELEPGTTIGTWGADGAVGYKIGSGVDETPSVTWSGGSRQAIAAIVVKKGKNLVKTPVEPLGEWTMGLSKAKTDGKNRVLIIHTTAKHNNGATINGVRLTYGGQPMTKLYGANSFDPIQTAFTSISYVFILNEEGINAADNTGTIVPTWQLNGDDVAIIPNTGDNGIFHFSAFYGNVDQLKHFSDSSYFISNSSVAANTPMESRAVQNESGDMGLIFYHHNGNNATLTNNTPGFELAINRPGQAQGTSYIASKFCDGTAFIPSIAANAANRGSIMGLALKQVEEEGVPPVTYALTANTTTGGTIKIDPMRSKYVAGAVVTVTATPDFGYNFVNWTGDIESNDLEITIEMNSDKIITANFVEKTNFYKLTVNATNGTVNITPNDGSYDGGTVVTIKATPNFGYAFVNWTGDLESNDAETTILMDSPKTITANFVEKPKYTLTTEVSNGHIYLTPAGGTYYEGVVVGVRVVANVGYTFKEWDGDLSGTETSKSIVMDSDKTIIAVMEEIPAYTLTVTASNGGSTRVIPAQLTYEPGSAAIIVATPDAGFRFKGWEGDLTGKQNPSSIVMNSDKNVTAVFELIPASYTLTVAATNGSVSLNPAGGTYEDGTVVTLTATADDEFEFSAWSGALSGSVNPTTITVDGNKSVTAVFTSTLDVNEIINAGQDMQVENYPNPFSTFTTISYRLNKDSQVRLTIYNILGEKITTLVDHRQMAGKHEIDWDAKTSDGKSLSSGIYVYRLEVDNILISTKKAVINK